MYIHVKVFTYLVFYRTIENRVNINFVIGIQRSLRHVHWPIFKDEKKESIGIVCAYFYKNSCCIAKGNAEQILSIIQKHAIFVLD